MALQVETLSSGLGGSAELTEQLQELLTPLGLTIFDVIIRAYGDSRETGLIVVFDDTGDSLPDATGSKEFVTVGAAGDFATFSAAVNALNSGSGGVIILLDASTPFGVTDLDLSNVEVRGCFPNHDASGIALNLVKVTFDGTGHVTGGCTTLTNCTFELSQTAPAGSYIIDDDVDKTVRLDQHATIGLEIGGSSAAALKIFNKANAAKIVCLMSNRSIMYANTTAYANAQIIDGAGSTFLKILAFEGSAIGADLSSINSLEFDSSYDSVLLGSVNNAVFEFMRDKSEFVTYGFDEWDLSTPNTVKEGLDKILTQVSLDGVPPAITQDGFITYDPAQQQNGLYYYDGTRTKWLSDNTPVLKFTSSGVVPNNSFIPVAGHTDANASSHTFLVFSELMWYTISQTELANDAFDIELWNNGAATAFTFTHPASALVSIPTLGYVSGVSFSPTIPGPNPYDNTTGLQVKIINAGAQLPRTVSVTLYLRWIHS